MPRSRSRPSAAGQALRIASICAGGSGARAARCACSAFAIGWRPCASAASCRLSASWPEAGADLRQHAQPLDRPAARRQHAAPGDEQLAAVRQRRDRLHQPLAEGGAADHHAAAAVGQRGGQDLGGAGGAAVHHHDDRHVLGQLAGARIARCAIASGSRPAVIATTPGRQQAVGRRDRLAQQPAAIAAQVQHDAVRAGAGPARPCSIAAAQMRSRCCG